MSIETNVANYYTRERLEESILQALTRAGKDSANLTHGDLAALDEFQNFMSVAAKLPKNWLLKWSCVLAYISLMWGAGSAGQVATLPWSTDAELREST